MDEELKAYLDGMESRIMKMEGRLIKLINDQHERLIDKVGTLSRDFQNTKGFLIEDAIVLGRRMTNIENRLDDLK